APILPKPSITIEPAGVITFGELVTITCSISTQLLNGSFTLQRRKPNYRYVYNSNFYDMKSQLSSTNSSIFRFLEVSSNHEGYYRCYYKKAVTIRTLTSPFSDVHKHGSKPSSTSTKPSACRQPVNPPGSPFCRSAHSPEQ
uniref:Ig-like domain-containing protein n=1 Tax=Cyprinodon variegatus TaxID=28743 RepID=A0A3Q2CV15_CYPVA